MFIAFYHDRAIKPLNTVTAIVLLMFFRSNFSKIMIISIEVLCKWAIDTQSASNFAPSLVKTMITVSVRHYLEVRVQIK